MNEETVIHDLAVIDQRSRGNARRIETLEHRVDVLARLTTAVEVMASEQRAQTAAMVDIKRDVATLGDKVGTLEKKPAKRWEMVVERTIYLLLGAVGTWFAAFLQQM